MTRIERFKPKPSVVPKLLNGHYASSISQLIREDLSGRLPLCLMHFTSSKAFKFRDSGMKYMSGSHMFTVTTARFLMDESLQSVSAAVESRGSSGVQTE